MLVSSQECNNYTLLKVLIHHTTYHSRYYFACTKSCFGKWLHRCSSKHFTFAKILIVSKEGYSQTLCGPYTLLVFVYHPLSHSMVGKCKHLRVDHTLSTQTMKVGSNMLCVAQEVKIHLSLFNTVPNFLLYSQSVVFNSTIDGTKKLNATNNATLLHKSINHGRLRLNTLYVDAQYLIFLFSIIKLLYMHTMYGFPFP